MSSQALTTKFTKQVIATNSLTYQKADFLYLHNRVLALVGEDLSTEATDENLLTLCDQLVALAVKNKQIQDLQSARDNLAAALMDLVNPLPHVVNAEFQRRYASSPEAATDYFYALSQTSDYIKTRAIAKNTSFTADSDFGKLEITINLSKPEKDPRQIAAAKNAKPSASQYPLCQLCKENEGYYGRLDYPARSNLRLIHHEINGEGWEFQYSPYAYFPEHAIFLADEHRPMAITKETFANLLAIVTWLPHYFVGSNADLPIVGGSILTHDHYQGGRHTFPMEVAPITLHFQLPDLPTVDCGLVHWPMSVIRLTSSDQTALVTAANLIHESWQHYSDETVDIRATTNGVRHHTVTPIARRTKQGAYQLDLVLRDNQTSVEFPDGIFHPHPDIQHIKKENIGLIEVMGRAILPPRLQPELAEVTKYLLGQPNQMAAYHQTWADQIRRAHPEITATNVQTILQQALGDVFARVLADAGVFKQTPAGQAAFDRFIHSLQANH